jgi:hypothetical protein
MGLGNPGAQGATLIIDGADEAGIGQANELLTQAYVLAHTWTKTTVLITSRPIPSYEKLEEAVLVPLLTEQQAFEIIERVVGEFPISYVRFQLTRSLKDAIQRPLFAVLLATHLLELDAQQRPLQSTVELIESLIERAIGRIDIDTASANSLLQHLAAISIERGGGSVHKREIGTGDEIKALINSRLVIETAGGLSFPLPILTEWFAAHSIAVGNPTPDLLVESLDRLERWRYPLILFAGLFSYEQVSKVLLPLAEKYPSFASEIIDEGQKHRDQRAEGSLPPSIDCGNQIRIAMQAWVTGIGSLANLIAPITKDQMLLPLGVKAHRSGLLRVAWHKNALNVQDITELPPFNDRRLDDPNWVVSVTAEPVNVPAWAWKWTFNELRNNLTDLILHRSLPVSSGPLVREGAWKTALALLNNRDRQYEITRTGADGQPTTVLCHEGGIFNQSPIPWLFEVECGQLGPVALHQHA